MEQAWTNQSWIFGDFHLKEVVEASVHEVDAPPNELKGTFCRFAVLLTMVLAAFFHDEPFVFFIYFVCSAAEKKTALIFSPFCDISSSCRHSAVLGCHSSPS